MRKRDTEDHIDKQVSNVHDRLVLHEKNHFLHWPGVARRIQEDEIQRKAYRICECFD